MFPIKAGLFGYNLFFEKWVGFFIYVQAPTLTINIIGKVWALRQIEIYK